MPSVSELIDLEYTCLECSQVNVTKVHVVEILKVWARPLEAQQF